MDFSSETLEARKKWCNILLVLNGKNYQPQILYLVKIFFRHKEEIETF